MEDFSWYLLGRQAEDYEAGPITVWQLFFFFCGKFWTCYPTIEELVFTWWPWNSASYNLTTRYGRKQEVCMQFYVKIIKMHWWIYNSLRIYKRCNIKNISMCNQNIVKPCALYFASSYLLPCKLCLEGWTERNNNNKVHSTSVYSDWYNSED